jgi:hypothetical protein
LQEALHLDEVFRPERPPEFHGFSEDFGAEYATFHVSGVEFNVFFNNEEQGTVEIDFDADGVSSTRQFKNINTIELFQKVMWLICEYNKTHTANVYIIRPPTHEKSRLALYTTILKRSETQKYLDINDLDFDEKQSNTERLVLKKGVK